MAEVAATPIVATDAERGSEIIVTADQSLLNAIERFEPSSVAVGCRNGGCGLCRVQLLAGSVRLGKMSRRFVSIEMERERFALACRVYPQTNITYRLSPIEPRIPGNAY